MFTYLVYLGSILILIFVIFVTARTVYKNLSINKMEDNENSKINITSENKLNLIDELEKLNALYKSGAINEEEFTKAKKKILNEND
tara:strand:+ start:228 stop:485 length:258 start_codon:yes stop_codon:yes gene_type:complete